MVHFQKVDTPQVAPVGGTWLEEGPWGHKGMKVHRRLPVAVRGKLAVEGRVKTEVGKVKSAAALAVGGDTEGDTGALLGPGAGRPSLTYVCLVSSFFAHVQWAS